MYPRLRIVSASRPSGPNAPSKKRAVSERHGAPNVAPPSAEVIDCSVPRADTIVTAPAAPAPTSAGCASGEALSATIARGVHDRAPRGQAQNISGSPGARVRAVVGDVRGPGGVDGDAGRVSRPDRTGRAAARRGEHQQQHHGEQPHRTAV